MKKGYPVKSSPEISQLHVNSKPPGKLASMLRRFAMGERFHRFSAERVGEHVLPSSISTFQQTHGICFSRKWVTVPNRFGSETRVVEYWLQGKDLRKARKIVGLEEVAA